MNAPIDRCPRCGGQRVYRKENYHGSARQYENLDETVTEDNSDYYDGIQHNLGKWWYCARCHKRLFEDDPSLF